MIELAEYIKYNEKDGVITLNYYSLPVHYDEYGMEDNCVDFDLKVAEEKVFEAIENKFGIELMTNLGWPILNKIIETFKDKKIVDYVLAFFEDVATEKACRNEWYEVY